MIDLEPSIRRLNGTVVAPSHPSIARQMPNPVADAQWEEDVDLVRIIPITREDIEMMGGDVSTTAKLEDKDWGLGDNAYVGALDLFHNLHCLNTQVSFYPGIKSIVANWLTRLRRAAYGSYYNISRR